jgi:hypothetical protein
MTGRKKKPNSIVVSRVRRVVRGTSRHFEVLALAVMLLVIVVGGSYWGWQLLQQRGLNDNQYRVDADDIFITTESEWVESQNLKAEVMRDASLDEPVSILDDNLAERVALAFKAHPWVREVRRVEKFHPARVEVTVVYRDPVAVVAVGERLLPVDQEGVLLPIENFAPYRLLQFPKISGDRLGSSPVAGGLWSDSRVAAGAAIATVLAGTWREFGFMEIVPSALPIADEDDVFTFELVTSAGTRIFWGRQYLDDRADEPSAKAKHERLERYIDRNGDLEGFGFNPASASGGQTARRRTDRKTVR